MYFLGTFVYKECLKQLVSLPTENPNYVNPNWATVNRELIWESSDNLEYIFYNPLFCEEVIHFDSGRKVKVKTASLKVGLEKVI